MEWVCIEDTAWLTFLILYMQSECLMEITIIPDCLESCGHDRHEANPMRLD